MNLILCYLLFFVVDKQKNNAFSSLGRSYSLLAHCIGLSLSLSIFLLIFILSLSNENSNILSSRFLFSFYLYNFSFLIIIIVVKHFTLGKLINQESFEQDEEVINIISVRLLLFPLLSSFFQHYTFMGLVREELRLDGVLSWIQDFKFNS